MDIKDIASGGLASGDLAVSGRHLEESLNIFEDLALIVNAQGHILAANDLAKGIFFSSSAEVPPGPIEGAGHQALPSIYPYLRSKDGQRLAETLKGLEGLPQRGKAIAHLSLVVAVAGTDFMSGTNFMGNFKVMAAHGPARGLYTITIRDAVKATSELNHDLPVKLLADPSLQGQVGVAMKDIDGEYYYVNAGFEWLYGKEAKAILGKRFSDVFSSCASDTWLQNDEVIRRTKGPSTFYHKVMHGPLSTPQQSLETLYHCIGYPLMNARQEVVGILEITFDRKQQRTKVEHLLHTTFSTYSIMQSETIGFVHHKIICDAQGKPIDYLFLDMNQAFEHMTGLNYNDVIGKRVLEALPETEAYWIEIYGEVALTGRRRKFENYSTALGKTFLVEAFQTEPQYFSVMVQDISERKGIEDELLLAYANADQANQMKAQFLMNISHEIRTPLNGIKGILELMALTEMPEAIRSLYGVLNGSFTALTVSLTDIIEYTELASGNRDYVNRNDFDLNELVMEVKQLFSASALQKGLKLKVDYDGQCPHHFKGDPIKVKQILTNIVSNAIKFTFFGSVTIEVSASAPVNGTIPVTISVRDTGIGIEHLNQNSGTSAPFQLFEQAYSGVDKRFSGLGLGLAITQEICHILGAELAISSQPGAGTCVAVTLPLAGVGAIRRTALVLEEDPVSGVLLSLMLQNEGLDVTRVSSLALAAEYLQDSEADLVFVELDHLSTADIQEGIALLRASKRSLVFVGMVTSRSSDLDQLVSDLKLKALLRKPVSKEDLVQVIGEATGL